MLLLFAYRSVSPDLLLIVTDSSCNFGKKEALSLTLNRTDRLHKHVAPCGGTGRPPLVSTLNKYISYSTTNEQKTSS